MRTWLRTIVLDCDDLNELAEFWSGVLQLPIVERSADWWELASSDGVTALAVQKVGKHRPPSARRPQQLHIDVGVDDLDAAQQHVLALGATPLGDVHEGAGRPWRVYADPAGHPFCLCTC